MKRKVLAKKNLCLSAVCLGIAIAFLEAGAVCEKKTENFSHTVTMMSEDDGFGAEIIQGIKEDPEQENTFTAWKEIPDSILSAKESGRTSRADAMMLYGPSYCVLPYGKTIDQEDTAGCLIGKKVAEDLFGSHQVEGQELVFEDRTFTVRGVIKEPETLFLYETLHTKNSGFMTGTKEHPAGTGGSDTENTSDGTELSFDRISFYAENAKDGRKAAEDFMNRYGWNAEILRFDLYQDLSWAKELIPGKWSDFSGWKENLKNQKKQKEQVSRMRKSCLETEYLRLLRERNRYILLGIAGIVMCSVIFVFGIRKQVKPEQRQWLQTAVPYRCTANRR